MIRAVLFDLGSTLVTGPGVGVPARLAARLGIGDARRALIGPALMTRPFETPDEAAGHLAPELGLARAEVAAAVEEIWTAQLTEASALPGALACLERWARTGASLGLVSNIWKPYQLSAAAALAPALDAAIPEHRRIYSYRIGAAKPSTGPILRALEALGARPEEAVFVGDSYKEDMAPAMALGLRTVWVLHRPDREKASLAAVASGEARPPTWTIPSIDRLGPDEFAGERA